MNNTNANSETDVLNLDKVPPPKAMTYGDLLQKLEAERKNNPSVLQQPITVHKSFDDGSGGWCCAVSFCMVKGEEPKSLDFQPHCGWPFEELEDGRFYLFLDT